MKKMEEAKNKVKKFVRKHKKVIIAISGFATGYVGTLLWKQHNAKITDEAFKAGIRITDLSHNTAAAKIVGDQKAAEIAIEELKIEKLVRKKFSNANVSYKQFNNMYDHNLLGLNKLPVERKNSTK